MFFFFCFKQKTAYEMRISDWSSTCALPIYEILTSTIQNRETAAGKANVLAASVIIDGDPRAADKQLAAIAQVTAADIQRVARTYLADEHSAAIRYLPAESAAAGAKSDTVSRSEEHTSELQSLMRTSYAVFCLKKKKKTI